MSEVTTQRRASRTLAIMSGKGGTGKSLVTSLLAVVLRRRGLRVGILDGNITCSGITPLFGIQDEYPSYTLEGIDPPVSAEGIKIMAVNSTSETENEPLVWRGPMVSSAFKQFYDDVQWGELDYLLIDTPPGTADIAMSVMQLVPLSGVILVSTPQVMVGATLKKCIGMIKQYGAPISGLMENMAYLIDESGEYSEPFGPSTGQQLAAFAGAPFLGQLPLDPYLAALADSGQIERYASESFEAIVAKLLTSL